MIIDYDLLSKQDANTSNAIISRFEKDELFLSLSLGEGVGIRHRDAEDNVKLQAGIDLAKEKGVIDPSYVAEPYTEIDVLGQTPEQVARKIMESVDSNSSGSSSEDDDNTHAGKVVVICGLSGTGKGTTVTKLQEMFGTNRQVVCWSNGNIFRSLTLVAVDWARQHSVEDLGDALTKDNLASFLTRLSCARNEDTGHWDTSISGLELENDSTSEKSSCWVSDIQNTLLKGPHVSRNIPTVAKVTQGEVILFAADAIQKMVRDDANLVVLLEGRQQTVDYVRSSHRFVLTLSDGSLIGKRRAAQRIMAAALARAEKEDTVETIQSLLKDELEKMV